ncbi:MAG: LPS assembly lipoprotein LptE [Proteobacteria bacterium]|nr:LPS assembly lipoprotein LptE [Pseudomonadota bacterium]MDA1323157.1 LPS assembly lipoprotein LptE [Pseudomonadota bacterium]
MWFIRKRPAGRDLLPALGVIALLLSGCGFRPLYQSGGGSDEAALATIEVVGIKDRLGQQLRNLLTERLSPRGRSARTDYRLTVTLNEARQGLAIRKDETATRANLTINADFKLVALANPRLGTFAGKAHSTISYNILTSDFATLSAEKDARNRASRALAEEIRLRVASALRNPRAFSGPPADQAPR